MKNKILFLLVTLASLCLNAQSQNPNTYYDFQNSIVAPVCSTFQSGQFSSSTSPWKVSHGSPELANPFQQNFYTVARLRTSNPSTPIGEGLYIPYSFQKNHLYSITISLRVEQGLPGIIVSMANGLTPYTAANCSEAAFPTKIDRKELFNETLGSDFLGSFKTLTIDTFQPQGKNYSFFWIASNATSLPAANFLISQVTITDEGPVPPITNNVICCEQTILTGNTPVPLKQAANMAVGGGFGTYSYKWESSIDEANFVDAIPAGTSSSYAPPQLTQTTWYRRVVNGESSPMVKIDVTGTIYDNTITANQTFTTSPADPAPLIGSTPRGGTNNQFSYQWQYLPYFGTWQNVSSGGNAIDYNPPIIEETTSYRRIITSNGIVSTSNTITATVTVPASGSLAFNATCNGWYLNNTSNYTQAFGSNFTIESWIKLAPDDDAHPIVYLQGPVVAPDGKVTTFEFFFSLVKSASTWYLIHKVTKDNTSSQVTSSNLPNMLDNQWHHIAMTRAGNAVRFFLDGVEQVGGQSTIAFKVQKIQFFYIGQSFTGDMSEFRIWNVDRTPGEIDYYKNQYIPVYSGANLLGYWRLNESKGKVIDDESRFNNDGLAFGQSVQPRAAPFSHNTLSIFNEVYGSGFDPITYNATTKKIAACQKIFIGGSMNAAIGAQIDVIAGTSIEFSQFEGNHSLVISPGFSFSIAPCDIKNGRKTIISENLQIVSLENEILAYPNPTADKVTIELLFEPTSPATIQVYNMLGSMISSTSSTLITPQQYEVDLSNSPSGIYLIRVLTNKGSVTKKVNLDQ